MVYPHQDRTVRFILFIYQQRHNLYIQYVSDEMSNGSKERRKKEKEERKGGVKGRSMAGRQGNATYPRVKKALLSIIQLLLLCSIIKLMQ